MTQAMVNFRMDADLKKEMEQVCQDMGLNMTTAFTIFAKKVSREKRIPFEVSTEREEYEFDKMKATLTLLSKLAEGEESARKYGYRSIEEFEDALGVNHG